ILALQVELGELANEWRGFKYWGDYDVPEGVQKSKCDCCEGKGFYDQFNSSEGHWTVPCHYCSGSGLNPLLEEYADVLHFALSIGNDLGGLSESFEKSITFYSWEHWSVEKHFFEVTKLLVNVQMQIENSSKDKMMYALLLQQVIRLGHKLGFTWEQIEEAYYIKNKINHERQEANY
ncbi:MAG TPA: dUTP diphosphatase, partial [Solibacillus sp.]